MTVWKIDRLTVMDFHDGEAPIIAELTYDELMMRVKRAVSEGYKVEMKPLEAGA